ncbi:MAG TPA: C39 family peptidase [Burkholderiaceae bacterium]
MSAFPKIVPLVIAALLCSPDSALATDVVGFGGARFKMPVTSLKEVRFKTTLRQQYDFSCGSAAIATLLTHHYNEPVTEAVVFEYMYATGDQPKIRREGFSLLDMKRFLKSRGYTADGFNLPLEKLAEANYPAIVLLSEKGYNHFVVVKGISKDRVLIGDPAGGTRSVARDTFESMWSSKLLFVIHQGPRKAQFNQLVDWSAAPTAPVALALHRNILEHSAIPKHGPGDY